MGQSLAIPRVIPNDWKRLDLIVSKIKLHLGRNSSPTFANTTITNVITASTSVFSKICTVAAGLNVLRVTGLQTDGVAMTGTLRGAYIDVSNGSTAATGTIRALELKARTEAPGDTGNDVTTLEGLSISADSKGHSVTTMRAAEFILDGSTGGTITEAVGLRIANNLQADKATNSYGLQIYRDSFDYTYDISLSLGGHITGDSYVNQDLRTTASPTHAGLTLTGLTASALIATNASKLLESVTIGTGLAYATATLSLSHLGIQNLSDAGADRILFWDDDQSACKWLIPNTLISITGTNLNVDNDLHNYSWTSVDATDLKVGSVTQAFDVVLDDISALDVVADNEFIVGTGAGVYAHESGDTVRTSLGLAIGTNVQAHSDALDDLTNVGTVTGDSYFLVGTGTGTLAWETTTTARTSIGLGTGDSPTFTAASLGTGELTCGSINRATGTLTLEIDGTAEVSITATTVTLGGNLIIPDNGTIGSASDTDVMTIDASGNCTFSVFPITPSAAPDANYEVANKKYVDDNAGGAFTSKCSVYRTAVQVITTSTWTKVQLNLEDYDIDGEFDSTTNYRFQPDVAGYYHVSGAVQLGSLGSGKVVYVGIYKTGALLKPINVSNGTSVEFAMNIAVSCDVYLAVTDYVELWVYHNHGSNRNAAGSGRYTYMDVHRFA